MSQNIFKTRLLTSLAIGICMIGLILWSQLSTQVLLLIICLMCNAELYQMSVTRFSVMQTGMFALVMTLPAILVIVFPAVMQPIDLALIGVFTIPAAGGMYLLFSIRQTPTFFVKRMKAVGISMIFIVLPIFLGIYVTTESRLAILGVFILIWCSDIGAYVVGSWIGKTKLSPLISPGKTWEGLAGGAIITFVAAWLIGFQFTELSPGHWLMFAGCVMVFGTFGDLLESAIKRAHDVKDSGKLLPGHGGFYDRFDSFLGCIPWIALLMALFV